MAPTPLNKQIASCKSSYDWLMSLNMDLAALCDMWSQKQHQWYHLAVFSLNTTFVSHFMAPHYLPPSTPIEVLRVFYPYQQKNYLKWWAIQLAIHSTVGIQIDYKQLQSLAKLHTNIYFPSRNWVNRNYVNTNNAEVQKSHCCDSFVNLHD